MTCQCFKRPEDLFAPTEWTYAGDVMSALVCGVEYIARKDTISIVLRRTQEGFDIQYRDGKWYEYNILGLRARVVMKHGWNLRMHAHKFYTQHAAVNCVHPPNLTAVLRERTIWYVWLHDCDLENDFASFRKLVWRMIVLIRNGAPGGKYLCKDVCALIYRAVFVLTL